MALIIDWDIEVLVWESRRTLKHSTNFLSVWKLEWFALSRWRHLLARYLRDTRVMLVWYSRGFFFQSGVHHLLCLIPLHPSSRHNKTHFKNIQSTWFTFGRYFGSSRRQSVILSGILGKYLGRNSYEKIVRKNYHPSLLSLLSIEGYFIFGSVTSAERERSVLRGHSKPIFQSNVLSNGFIMVSTVVFLYIFMITKHSI